jgi:clan AA aspartic protease (TIGR02281 family)
MRLFKILGSISFWLFICYSTNAQVKCDAKLQYDNVFYSVCIMSVDPTSIRYISLVQNKVGLSHSDFVDEYIANNDSVMFATNACIGDGSGSPLGLFISEGKQLSGINLNDGKGNFFLKPNGVLLVSDSSVIISESSKVKITSSINWGVQSGPMLVIDDQIHSVFDASSKNQNIRSGVGLYSEKGKQYFVFCKSNEPVSFYKFASLFKDKFKCSNALCLESAGSAMYSPSLGIIPPESGSTIGNYIIIKKRGQNNLNRKKIIQMTKSPGGTYDIPVELNGVLKISFIFDSGASDVSISPDVALTLMKTGTIKESDFIGTQQYMFANGSTATSQVFILQEIKIGGYVIKKVRASISNSIDAPMLLGQSVLQRLGKFGIDNNNHTLTIE